MDGITQYHAAITAMLQKIMETQPEAIGRAARRLADVIQEDRYIYVIGRAATATSRAKRCSGGRAVWCRSILFWIPGFPSLTGPGALC